MGKKKMYIDYDPAVIIKGHRWYIKYYQTNPETGKKERFRETFDLNRIKDLEERQALADQHILQINSKLPLGFPFVEAYSELPANTNILAALEVAKKVCMDSDRKNTNRNFSSMSNIFSEWLRMERLDRLAIGDFRKSHAVAFMDYAVWEREIGARTYNNYKERMYGLFKALKKRCYVKRNFFKSFKKKKVHGKRRRAFSEWEMEVVAERISSQDAWLSLGILLQYHCFIRPIELRRLTFRMFDLKHGTISLSSAETKNRETAIVTIPDVLLPHLQAFNFQQYNQDWLLFGEWGRPHPAKACGHDALNSRHKTVLENLQKEGKLGNIKGLSFYSWKDTGALALFRKKVNMLEIMRQLRHKDLSTTQKYCQSLYVINEEIKTLHNPLMAKIVQPKIYSIIAPGPASKIG